MCYFKTSSKYLQIQEAKLRVFVGCLTSAPNIKANKVKNDLILESRFRKVGVPDFL